MYKRTKNLRLVVPAFLLALVMALLPVSVVADSYDESVTLPSVYDAEYYEIGDVLQIFEDVYPEYEEDVVYASYKLVELFADMGFIADFGDFENASIIATADAFDLTQEIDVIYGLVQSDNFTIVQSPRIERAYGAEQFNVTHEDLDSIRNFFEIAIANGAPAVSYDGYFVDALVEAGLNDIVNEMWRELVIEDLRRTLSPEEFDLHMEFRDKVIAERERLLNEEPSVEPFNYLGITAFNMTITIPNTRVAAGIIYVSPTLLLFGDNVNYTVMHTITGTIGVGAINHNNGQVGSRRSYTSSPARGVIQIRTQGRNGLIVQNAASRETWIFGSYTVTW